MSLGDIRYQDGAQRLIQRALRSHRTPHAYIFAGPEGVGRELFAERLARVLLCEAPVEREAGAIGIAGWDEGVADACGVCRSCELASVASHPDYHLVYRELYREHPDALVRGRKGLGLSIDVIRHFVNDQVMLKPVMGRAKVFVVRGAEMMSLAAQNALLKTLEEPPATTFIVLITASTASLLETTRSRCQLASFGLVPRDFIVESLVCHFDGLSEQAAAWYADRAAGSLGAAIRMVEDGLVDFDARAEAVLTAGEGVSVPDLAKALLAEAAELGGKYKERDGDISETEAQRRGIKALLMLMAAQMRERMAAACGDQNVSDAALKAMAEGIRGLATTERQLELNVNPQLCVETGLIRLRRKVSPSAA